MHTAIQLANTIQATTGYTGEDWDSLRSDIITYGLDMGVPALTYTVDIDHWLTGNTWLIVQYLKCKHGLENVDIYKVIAKGLNRDKQWMGEDAVTAGEVYSSLNYDEGEDSDAIRYYIVDSVVRDCLQESLMLQECEVA